MLERRLSPYTQIGFAALACSVIAGAAVAMSIGIAPRLWIPATLLCASFALLVTNLALLARREAVDWERFRLFAGTAFAMYVVRTGAIGYAFVAAHESPGRVALFVAALSLYAIEVPTIIGLTSARRSDPSAPPEKPFGKPPRDWP